MYQANDNQSCLFPFVASFTITHVLQSFITCNHLLPKNAHGNHAKFVHIQKPQNLFPNKVNTFIFAIKMNYKNLIYCFKVNVSTIVIFTIDCQHPKIEFITSPISSSFLSTIPYQSFVMCCTTMDKAHKRCCMGF